jgi:hypothetical protein
MGKKASKKYLDLEKSELDKILNRTGLSKSEIVRYQKTLRRAGGKLDGGGYFRSKRANVGIQIAFAWAKKLIRSGMTIPEAAFAMVDSIIFALINTRADIIRGAFLARRLSRKRGKT